jgi:hypothetical protein
MMTCAPLSSDPQRVQDVGRKEFSGGGGVAGQLIEMRSSDRRDVSHVVHHGTRRGPRFVRRGERLPGATSIRAKMGRLSPPGSPVPLAAIIQERGPLSERQVRPCRGVSDEWCWGDVARCLHRGWRLSTRAGGRHRMWAVLEVREWMAATGHPPASATPARRGVRARSCCRSDDQRDIRRTRPGRSRNSPSASDWTPCWLGAGERWSGRE